MPNAFNFAASPFDCLTPDEQRLVRASVDIAYFPEGAVVLDVGMNRNDEGKLCGDVDFEGVKNVAGWITPVPGGVGPMTITMLLVNTMESAERAAQ